MEYEPLLTCFTKKAVHILSMAEEEAKACSADSPGSVHVFLALLRYGKGIPSILSNEFDIQYDDAFKISKSFRSSKVSGGDVAINGVIRAAIDEAKKLNHDYPGPEHLLIALLRDETSHVRDVIRSQGVEPQTVFEEVFSILGNDVT